MKQSVLLCSPLLATLATASLASAETYYAKPGGTWEYLRVYERVHNWHRRWQGESR